MKTVSKAMRRRILTEIQANLDKQAVPRLHLYFGNANPHVVRDSGQVKVASSQECADLIRPFFTHGVEHREEFWIILLNRALKVIGVSQASAGGVHGTVADPKIIFGTALLAQASGIILVHNHPSGHAQPSLEDRELTRSMCLGAKLLSMQIHDHLILTRGGHYSFADQGLIEY